jgi:NAD(P)-dependent dehydrogenase (short-subunit alcohol dehydrogenase family)
MRIDAIDARDDEGHREAGAEGCIRQRAVHYPLGDDVRHQGYPDGKMPARLGGFILESPWKRQRRIGISGRMTLTDRVALITGGKRIGQVVAHVLAESGVHIAVAYRGSKAEADETVAAVVARGRQALAIAADVSREADVRMLVQSTVDRFGRLDLLVNMASVYKSRPFETTTGSEWDQDLNVNLKASFIAAQAAAPHLRKTGGRIVNFSDWLAASGRPAYRDFVAYYVAKAGVKALTEALALQLAPEILVNAIAPGPILPPPDLSEAELQEVANATPVHRWGGAMEIAKAVLALAETDFITGETIRVDGGRHVQ